MIVLGIFIFLAAITIGPVMDHRDHALGLPGWEHGSIAFTFFVSVAFASVGLCLGWLLLGAGWYRFLAAIVRIDVTAGEPRRHHVVRGVRVNPWVVDSLLTACGLVLIFQSAA